MSDGPPFRTPRLYSLGGSGIPKPEQAAPAKRFAMLALARDLAADAGDVRRAIRAVDTIDHGYHVNGPKMRVDAFVRTKGKLADAFDLGVGDTISFALQDGVDRLDAEIASVVSAIPGAPTNIALLMDLGVIQHYQLRTTDEPARARDVWVRTDEPEAVAREVRALFPANAQIETAVDAAGPNRKDRSGIVAHRCKSDRTPVGHS